MFLPYSVLVSLHCDQCKYIVQQCNGALLPDTILLTLCCSETLRAQCEEDGVGRRKSGPIA